MLKRKYPFGVISGHIESDYNIIPKKLTKISLNFVPVINEIFLVIVRVNLNDTIVIKVCVSSTILLL